MATILYANTIDYNFDLQQRPHHIMNLLAKRGHIIHWVNKTKVEGLRPERYENLTVWHNWDVFKKRVPEIDVYFSSWSFRHTDLKEIDYKICLYDSLDNFKENESHEEDMIEKSDILLVTSYPLYELRKTQHKNIHICRNGCFADYGKKDYEVPSDVKKFVDKGGYILFSGAIANWVDNELIEKVAKKYNVVIVGKQFGVDKMPKHAHYLGIKSYEELQAYYNHCSVNILPFKRCQTSDYSNPIKNYEAMTHGKITVATDIPEATIYPDIVLPSRNSEEFMNNIKKALEIKDDVDIKNECFKNAEDNDWNKRVDLIESLLFGYAKEHNININIG